MTTSTRTVPRDELREPTFPTLRAIRDCDRREHVEAQIAGGVSRSAAERHADEEEAFDLPPLP